MEDEIEFLNYVEKKHNQSSLSTMIIKMERNGY